MNRITSARITQRFTAVAVAIVMTAGMLFGVDSLATSEPGAAQLARAAQHNQA